MRVFRDLDFLDQMEEAKFPHKFGAAWTAEDQGAYEMNFQGGFKDKDQINPESHVEIRFNERQQEGVDREYTYHVDRSKFDLMLLQHANKLGSAAHEAVQASSLDSGPKEPIVRSNMESKETGVASKRVPDRPGP